MMITFDHIQFDIRKKSQCTRVSTPFRNEVIIRAPFKYTHIRKMTSLSSNVGFCLQFINALVPYGRNRTPFRDTQNITSYRIILYLGLQQKQSSSLFSFSSIHSYVIVILRCTSRNQLNIVVMSVPPTSRKKDFVKYPSI